MILSHSKDRDVLGRPVVTKTYTIGGKNITFESGRLGLFASGAAVITDEDGNFLLTTTGIWGEKDGDFFPLTVEFQEKYYAAGKIWGNRFMKREGRPSENAILTSRMIDRPIRPMFPKGTRTEIQIISTIMSSSGVWDFGFYGITGASLSLLLAGIREFEWPVSWVRIVADVAWNFIFDPNFEALQNAHLDLTVAGTADAITMVESQGKEVSNDLMVRAFAYAHSIVKELCDAQKDFVSLFQRSYEFPLASLVIHENESWLIGKIGTLLTEAEMQGLYWLGKIEFHDVVASLYERVKTHLMTEWMDGTLDDPTWTWESISRTESNFPYSDGAISESLKENIKHHMRETVLSTKTRLDGRRTDEVRPVRATAPILARTHGSALFERGVTQVLSVTTLGGPSDIQIIDDMYEEDTKRYIHHYNFTPFSVWEVKPIRGVGRREVWHGRLAEKALEPVLPDETEFPYMIRVVSETTTCNGSSSMASVCGSTLSLMDAWVPIRKMVAGVALGMIYESPDRYEVIADIQAQEDFLGDMDFKVARTRDGITALQMDCKIAGLSIEVIERVFATSVSATEYILSEMEKCLSEPRKELSPYAPFLLAVQVPEEKMREVIGKWGETIQGIEKNFSVEVDLADDGKCTVTAKTQEAWQKAIEFIKNIIKDVEIGDIYEGKIIKILDTVGAIVEIGKGKEGMIHISKFGLSQRIANVNEVAKVGDTVKVKVYSIDKEKGRIGLEKIG